MELRSLSQAIEFFFLMDWMNCFASIVAETNQAINFANAGMMNK